MNLCCINAYSQSQYYCTYDIRLDNSIIIKAVYNNDETQWIDVYIDGKDCGRIAAKRAAKINKECT